MATMTLYALTDALLELEDRLIEAGGVLDEETEAALEALEGAFSAKADSILALRQSLVRAAEAAKAEAERLRELATVRENAARSLADYLVREMTRRDLQQVETDRFRASICRNSRPSIRWTRDEDPPEAYRRVRVELDGTAAYEAWRAGTPLPEGFVVELGLHLRVR